jgi:hypothetical protein
MVFQQSTTLKELLMRCFRLLSMQSLEYGMYFILTAHLNLDSSSGAQQALVARPYSV